ncbi:MAG: serine/threonine-protein phosphatase [Phycisphaeraceae bacterium]|nr:serine/threonine-protein phosphatase [Phycisphaeraceae bacterium]
MGRMLVVTDGGAAPDRVPSGVQKVLSYFRGLDRPHVSMQTLSRVLEDASLLDDVESVWLLLDDPAAGDLFAITGECEDRHLPTLLTRPGGSETVGEQYGEGIVACPPGTAPEEACVVLQTLLSQAPILAAMRREVKVLTVQHHGLCSQIGKLDEELRMAAQFQREFLPNELPNIEPVSFHVLYRPAGYVSGDIYDVQRLDEHHIGFFVADAVGHGVPAALMTVYIKRSLRGKQIDPNAPNGYKLLTPAQALAQLNADMISTQNGKVRFATACYGVLDTRTMQLTMARAGHPFPMLLRGEDDHVETVEPEGGLLGVFEDEVYEETTFELKPGDRLLIYSDGFECAFPDDENSENGKRRVANENYAKEFLDLGNGDPAAAIQRLEDKLDEQAGSLNQKDDLTVLCLAVSKEAGALANDSKADSSKSLRLMRSDVA